MTRLAQVLFAVVVIATLGAFLLAQRLKQAPKAVEADTLTRVFSPNGDGRNEQARFSIRLRRGDDVDVTVLDRQTDREVRHLIVNRHIAAKQTVFFNWDGRTDAGVRAPDAYYKLLITLRGQGRSSIANKRFILDTAPPRPDVRALGPGSGPVIIPARGARPGVTLRVADPGTDAPQWTIWRTDTPKPAAVARIGAAQGQREVYWDGLVAGRPAPAGTYAAQVRTRDGAGNVGVSPARVPPRGDVRGRPGITVRYLAAQVPMQSIRSGKGFDVFVDARGKDYRWRLRRIGGTRTVAAGTSSDAKLRLQAPGGAPGVYLLELTAAGHVYRTPIAVQAGKANRPILVVLPALSWQGRNPVDDDGKGTPDTLTTTGTARLLRPFAGDGLPLGFTQQEGPLLAFLQRHGLGYDVTTDAALLANRGPKLARHQGVVLAGEPEWIPTGLGTELRTFAERGGNVLSLGTDALRRTARVHDGVIDDPTPNQPEDVFGSRIKGIQRPLAAVELLTYADKIKLFSPTAGAITGYDAFEQTASTGGGDVLAAAGEQAGQPVIVAYRLGKGMVLRTGLPQWTVRLGSDQETAAVTRRMWTLLSQ